MKSRVFIKVRKIFLALMLVYGTMFPRSGVITDGTKDSDYESNDEYSLFI